MKKDIAETRSSGWRKAGRPARSPHRFRVRPGTPGPGFEFIGGDQVLDFNNTAAWSAGGASNDRLPRPADLIRWSAEAGVISKGEEVKLRKLLRTQRDRTNRALADAIRLRHTLHGLLVAVAEGVAPDAGNLNELNQRLRTAARSMTLEWRAARLGWTSRSATGMTAIIDRIAWCAGELLASDELARLRCCANPDCGWLFLDRSRNGTRRWCSMKECGDRAKSKRYYQRERQSK